eukprot:m.32384 g.32384  ORF g.32384 m.32384 type:complete len:215 (-) comp9511_c1_seq1:311-955(-)
MSDFYNQVKVREAEGTPMPRAIPAPPPEPQAGDVIAVLDIPMDNMTSFSAIGLGEEGGCCGGIFKCCKPDLIIELQKNISQRLELVMGADKKHCFVQIHSFDSLSGEMETFSVGLSSIVTIEEHSVPPTSSAQARTCLQRICCCCCKQKEEETRGMRALKMTIMHRDHKKVLEWEFDAGQDLKCHVSEQFEGLCSAETDGIRRLCTVLMGLQIM